MNPRSFVTLAFLVLALGWFSYWLNFGFINKFEISNSQEHWGLLGDFLGGVINPILTFLTIIILVRSLTLQKEEVEKVKKHEKIRSFETHFFNMIGSQKVLYESFSLKIVEDNQKTEHRAAQAVISLEDTIINHKNAGSSFDEIALLFEDYDVEDKIYSVVRTFSIIVKLIEKKLRDDCGFDKTERIEYYEILINYTDFSLVRLVLIAFKYANYAQIKDLRENEEFVDVLEVLGVSDYLNDI